MPPAPCMSLFEDVEIAQHQKAQHDAIPAKGGEIVAADIVQEEADGEEGDQEGHSSTGEQYGPLSACLLYTSDAADE